MKCPPAGLPVSSLVACLLTSALLGAADLGKELLDAAAQGRTAGVQGAIDRGAALESKDKSGRTALMLAAQRGHADTVRMLLDRGADPQAKDPGGATAWVLAAFSSTGPRTAADEVLRILPGPPPPKLALEAGWSTANLYSSCSMRLDQLTNFVTALQPAGMANAAFRRYAAQFGKGLVEIAAANDRGIGKVPEDESFDGAGAVVAMVVRPAASCMAQQPYDNLSLTIDLTLIRASDRTVLLRKTFGAGLKGLHARTATSQAQYRSIYDELLNARLAELYWAAVEAWCRAA